MAPKKISRATPQELAIEWDDGHRGRHTLQTLRRYCPCAACAIEAEKNEANALFPILVPGKNELVSIDSVGAYALQFRWGDGHATGIYTYDYLRQICECPDCRKVAGE